MPRTGSSSRRGSSDRSSARSSCCCSGSASGPSRGPGSDPLQYQQPLSDGSAPSGSGFCARPTIVRVSPALALMFGFDGTLYVGDLPVLAYARHCAEQLPAAQATALIDGIRFFLEGKSIGESSV